MSHLGRVPTVGERFDVDGLSVEVLDAERRRVNKVRIWKKAPAENGVQERRRVRARDRFCLGLALAWRRFRVPVVD